MSAVRSPALILHLHPATAPAGRDRLVGLLAEYDVVAIHEDDLVAPRTWTVHFASAEARAAAFAALEALDQADRPRVEAAEVADEDWARRTQADLPAVRVGRIIVAPPWDLPAPSSLAASDVVVEIEPSRGFGTGHHQSTRLCLVLLQSCDLGGRTVLDVGTGSGVLAIAAARLGAAYVSAVDSDPDAVENARENIARNGVASAVEAHHRDLTDPGLPPADVVTANLTGTLLERHAPQLARLVRASGILIASGFNVDEKDRVAAALGGAFDLAETAEEDDWWGFVLTRRS